MQEPIKPLITHVVVPALGGLVVDAQTALEQTLVGLDRVDHRRLGQRVHHRPQVLLAVREVATGTHRALLAHLEVLAKSRFITVVRVALHFKIIYFITYPIILYFSTIVNNDKSIQSRIIKFNYKTI